MNEHSSQAALALSLLGTYALDVSDEMQVQVTGELSKAL